MKITIDCSIKKITKVEQSPIYFGNNNVDKIVLSFINTSSISLDWYPSLSAVGPDKNPIYPRSYDTDGITSANGITNYDFTLSNANGWNLIAGKHLFYVWINYPDTNGNECVGSFACTIIASSGYYMIDNLVVNPQLRQYLENSFEEHYNDVDARFEELQEDFHDDYTEEVNAQRSIINNFIGGQPRYVSSSGNILALTTNQGIAVSTDTGHWYYWNGTQYVDGGLYQSPGGYFEFKNQVDEFGNVLGCKVYSANETRRYLDIFDEFNNGDDIYITITKWTGASFSQISLLGITSGGNTTLGTITTSVGNKFHWTFTSSYSGIRIYLITTSAPTTNEQFVVKIERSNSFSNRLVDLDRISVIDKNIKIMNIKNVNNIGLSNYHTSEKVYFENSIGFTNSKYLTSGDHSNTNIFNYINATSSNANCKVSEVLRVRDDAGIALCSSIGVTYSRNQTDAIIAWLFDSEGNWISNQNGRVNLINIPNNCYFIVLAEWTESVGVGNTFYSYGTSNSKKIKYFTVGPENCDFTSLRLAIKEAVLYNSSTVFVNDGVYNLLDEFGSDFFNSFTSSTVEQGIMLSNDVHIIFSTNSKVICNYTGNNSAVEQYFSPFTVQKGNGGFTLENMTLECGGTRYAIHDEHYDDNVPYKNHYINCNIKFDGSYKTVFRTRQVIGGGLAKSGEIIIENCVFESVGLTQLTAIVSYHNSYSHDSGAKSRVVCKDSYFVGEFATFRCSYLGEQTEISEFYVFNNSFGKSPFVIAESSDTVVNVKLIAWNNTIRNN